MTRNDTTNPDSIAAILSECEAAARAEGWTGADWEPTAADLRHVERELRYKPTREQWAEAGLRGVGGAHVGAYILVEFMPESLRASHEAAGNAGLYPGNGAERFVIDADQEAWLDDDEIEAGWLRVVRPATPADMTSHDYRPEWP